jgi:hypothetical protein
MSDDLKELLRSGDPLDERAGLLDDADLDYARALVTGDESGEGRERAMELLVTVRAAGTAAALRRVIYNHAEETGLRARALHYLARLGLGVEGDLQESASRVSEPALLAETARGLALAGTPDSIPVLRRMARNPDKEVRRQAQFSLAVVAFRARLEGFELPVPRKSQLKTPDARHALPLTIEPIGVAQLVAGRRGRLETFGLDLDWDRGIRIASPSAEWLLLPERTLQQRDVVALAQAQPVLLGVVAREIEPGGPYATHWLVLSWPGRKDRIHVALHRPSGRQDLYGTAQVDDDEALFELAAVAGPGNEPAEIRGWAKGSVIGLSAGTVAETERR